MDQDPGSKNKVSDLVVEVLFRNKDPSHPIDNPSSLVGMPIFLFSGMNDNTIGPSVVVNTNWFFR